MPKKVAAYHCTQCGPVRLRAVALDENRKGEYVFTHNPVEGGCGCRVQRTERTIGTKRDPALASTPTTPKGTGRFQITASIAASGQFSATLGSSTFTDADDFWQALRANVCRNNARSEIRAARIAAERQAELANIDRAISEGRLTQAPAAKPKRAKTKPAASPSLSLDDLGL